MANHLSGDQEDPSRSTCPVWPSDQQHSAEDPTSPRSYRLYKVLIFYDVMLVETALDAGGQNLSDCPPVETLAD